MGRGESNVKCEIFFINFLILALAILHIVNKSPFLLDKKCYSIKAAFLIFLVTTTRAWIITTNLRCIMLISFHLLKIIDTKTALLDVNYFVRSYCLIRKSHYQLLSLTHNFHTGLSRLNSTLPSSYCHRFLAYHQFLILLFSIVLLNSHFTNAALQCS